jgi:hypothetical protein
MAGRHRQAYLNDQHEEKPDQLPCWGDEAALRILVNITTSLPRLGQVAVIATDSQMDRELPKSRRAQWYLGAGPKFKVKLYWRTEDTMLALASKPHDWKPRASELSWRFVTSRTTL